jgi:hypothetical protein
VFSPDLIIDAFPIVQSSRFNALPGSGGYVLIDPSAGNNHFSALADLFAAGAAPVRLSTELSFVQAFHRFENGASYEQIVTTYAQDPIASPGGVDPNEFRLAATLGISLRRYFASPEFKPMATPDRPHFFLSDPVNLPNTGAIAQPPVALGVRARQAAGQVADLAGARQDRGRPGVRRRRPGRRGQARHRVVERRVRLPGVRLPGVHRRARHPHRRAQEGAEPERVPRPARRARRDHRHAQRPRPVRPRAHQGPARADHRGDLPYLE